MTIQRNALPFAKRLAKSRLWALGLITLLSACAWWLLGLVRHTTNEPPRPVAQSAAPNLNQLLGVPSTELSHYDIALLNLTCATGLPGAESLDVQQCLKTLDDWAERVRSETARHLYRYRANPAEFENSEAYFRMLIMAVVLYEDFHVRYNPDRVTDSSDQFFANPGDVFLPGLCSNRRSGTCSSMPVLYVAIGRRLGYPLKLATTKAHVFLRWEGSAERFDLEATGKGMSRYDDQHFKQFPFPVTEAEIQADGYLKSLTGTEELALFLSLRGHCLRALGRISEAAACYAEAVRLAPHSRPYKMLLAAAQEQCAQPPSPAGATAPWPTPAGQPTPEPLLSRQLDPNPLLHIQR